MKWAIFGPQLLGRVAGHPKSLFVGHPVCPRRCANCQIAASAETRLPAPVRTSEQLPFLSSWTKSLLGNNMNLNFTNTLQSFADHVPSFVYWPNYGLRGLGRAVKA